MCQDLCWTDTGVFGGGGRGKLILVIGNACVMLNHVQVFVIPWIVAYQAPPSMGFSWQECWSGLPKYTEEVYKKDLHDPDNHSGVITHLQPDILECKVKWASLQTKLVEVMEFPLSYFKS